MGGGKERGVHPFQHIPRSLQAMCHDNKLNENHRLDSDLSTYNKLSGITLCITEMTMHRNNPAKMLESENIGPTNDRVHERHRQNEFV